MRIDGRGEQELRKIEFIRGISKHALGSCLVKWGNTIVYCTAMSVEEVPTFLANQSKGWLTCEYAMLPSSTRNRKIRERNKIDSRCTEIQRFIGRSLRSVVELGKLGPRTIWLDCDVIQADGGTRTAAICGSYIALAEACQKLKDSGKISDNPLKEGIAAVSVGKVQGKYLLDLCYEEDSTAEIDLNIVLTESGKLVEIQGGAEGGSFTTDELMLFINIATEGIKKILKLQQEVLKSPTFSDSKL